jgi:hypothetical protein
MAYAGVLPRGLGFLLAVVLVVELVEGLFPSERLGHRFAGPGFEWLVGVDGPSRGCSSSSPGDPREFGRVLPLLLRFLDD